MIYKTREWAELPSDADRADYRAGVLDFVLGTRKTEKYSYAYDMGSDFAYKNLHPSLLNVEDIKKLWTLIGKPAKLEEYADDLRRHYGEGIGVFVYAYAFELGLSDYMASTFMRKIDKCPVEVLVTISHIIEIANCLHYPSILTGGNKCIYAPHPYETLEEWAEENGVSMTELPELKEHTVVTEALAAELKRITRIPANFWVNLYDFYKKNAWGVDNTEL